MKSTPEPCKIKREETVLHAHKYLVCGASGYLGHNLCEYLLREGHIVTGVDINAWTGEEHDNFLFLQEDLSDPAAYKRLRGAIADDTIIFFLTGLSGTAGGFEHYARYVAVNELSLLHLLDTLRNAGIKSRIIFPSSRLLYCGCRGKELSEDAQKESKSIYAVNKIACEAYLEAYNNAFGIDYRVMRLGVPYGNLTGQTYSYGTIGFFLNQAKRGEITLYGDGSLRRTFTHVEDVCRQLFALAETHETAHFVYNACGENYSLRDVAQMIADRFHARVTYHPFPPLERKLESGDTVFDGSRMLRILQYPVKRNLADWLMEIQEECFSNE